MRTSVPALLGLMVFPLVACHPARADRAAVHQVAARVVRVIRPHEAARLAHRRVARRELQQQVEVVRDGADQLADEVGGTNGEVRDLDVAAREADAELHNIQAVGGPAWRRDGPVLRVKAKDLSEQLDALESRVGAG